MAEVERAIEEAGPGGAVLFEDETELRRFPPLRSAWMPYGEQRSVEVPKQNGKFALYGALDIESGRVVTEPHEKGRSDYTKSFLATLLRQVEGEILMVWDRASWHTSNAVEEWIAEHDSLEVVLLPKRAPEDNPVEDLWRRLKNVISANLERGLDVLKDACREFFDALSPRQALCTAGLAQN
jgi:transposase